MVTWRPIFLAVLLVSLVLWLLIYMLVVSTWRAVDEGAPPDPTVVAASAGRAFIADMDGQPTTTTVAPTTTTHPPRARTAPTVRAASRPVVETAGSVNGYPCGGSLPPCWVLKRESGGDPRIWNGRCYMPVGSYGQCGRSTASGLWQFLRSTWAGFGGYVNAADAPAEVQNEKARLLWNNRRGCSHWAAC